MHTILMATCCWIYTATCDSYTLSYTLTTVYRSQHTPAPTPPRPC